MTTPSANDNHGVSLPFPPTFLMCPPTFFDVDPEANHFSAIGKQVFDLDPDGFRALAMRQWEAFRDGLRAVGAQVIELTPQPGLIDQVFQADPSQTYILVEWTESGLQMTRPQLDVVSILSTFTNGPRAGEVAPQKEAIASFIQQIMQAHPEHFITARRQALSSYNHPDATGNDFWNHMVQQRFHRNGAEIEGTGDNLYDPFRDLIWAGHGIRSTTEAHRFLQQITGIETVSLELAPPFFHVDTTMAGLPNGEIMLCEAGLTPQALALLKKRAYTDFELKEEDYHISVSLEDAMRFALNVVPVGRHLFMVGEAGHDAPESIHRLLSEQLGMDSQQRAATLEALGFQHGQISPSQELIKNLTERGYEIHQFEMSALIMGGGALHCVTNPVSQTRIPGGSFQARLSAEKRDEAGRRAGL